MRDFSRIIPKHKHEAWMLKLVPIGNAERIINVLLHNVEPKNPTANDDVEHLRSLPMMYSDYHGVGILITPYFDIVIGTFPSLLEKAVSSRG